MATTIKTIKKNAIEALKDKWVIGIISALTFLFVFLIIQIIVWLIGIVTGDRISVSIMFIMFVVFMGPLFSGIVRHFWRMFGGLSETPATAFYYFSSFPRYFKVLRLYIMLAIKYIIWSIVFNLPAIAVSVISDVRLYDFLKIPIPMWSQNLTNLVDFLYTVGSVLTLFMLTKFYLAPFLLIVNDEIEVDEAIHMSAVISKASFTELIYLIFSILHWFILSLLFIPLVFTLPYFIMCYVSHSLEAVNSYNEKIKKLNDENFPSFVAGA